MPFDQRNRLVLKPAVDFEIRKIDREHLCIGVLLAQPNNRSVREIRLVLPHEFGQLRTKSRQPNRPESSPDSSKRHKLSTPEPYFRRRCAASATTDSQVTTGRSSREKTLAHQTWCWSELAVLRDQRAQCRGTVFNRSLQSRKDSPGRMFDRALQRGKALAPRPRFLQTNLVFQSFSQKTRKAQAPAFRHRSRLWPWSLEKSLWRSSPWPTGKPIQVYSVKHRWLGKPVQHQEQVQ